MLAFKGLLKASSGMQFALLKNGPNRLASLSLPFICLALVFTDAIASVAVRQIPQGKNV